VETNYWRGAAEDEAMQDEHGFIWSALLDTIDINLVGKRVLDAGCNRGGFLRQLVDRCGIAEGFGYDPASSAIEDARRLAARRPLHFETARTVPEGWDGFDAAFSHEVLYLLADLPEHARAVLSALRPGGVYYAVMGVHAGSTLMAAWHRANAEQLHLPQLYDINEVVAVFQAAGFDVAVSRLATHFVPTRGHGHHTHSNLLDWLEYYYEQKLVLRCSRVRPT
jgi:SAM-dependent methyltransferase